MHDDIAEVLYTEDEIQTRVAELGRIITAEYAERAARGDQIVLICVLRGAAMFMADLARRIKLPIEMDYMCLSSYGSGAKSSGTVRIVKDLETDVEGAHVIVAEDILDSGLTLNFLCKNLKARGLASLEVAAMFRKQIPDNEPIAAQCRYIGYEVPDEFIVGYGLDFAERYRGLPYVGVLKNEIYA